VVRRLRWTLLDQGELETQEEEAAGEASTGVEAEEAWMEMEVMVVVLIGDVVAMVAVVVVAVATVAASPEDMKEVVVVVEEGEASRMPMDSRSRTTKTCQPPLF